MPADGFFTPINKLTVLVTLLGFLGRFGWSLNRVHSDQEEEQGLKNLLNSSTLSTRTAQE